MSRTTTETSSFANDDLAALCADCGVDTTPCTGRRGCRHTGRWEYYVVRNEIWRAVGMEDGFLCIGCLEARLRRRLTRRDFPRYPINDAHDPWHTRRLVDRLRARAVPVRAPHRQLALPFG